jgi:hypothetical protein
MRISPILNFTGAVSLTTKWVDSFVQMIKNVYQNLAQAINGNLTFGDGTNQDNFDGSWININTPVTPNTDFTMNHNLGRIPAGYIVMEKNAACDVYTGSVVATKTAITLRATVAGVAIRLFIISLLLAAIAIPAFGQGDYFHDIALYNRGQANAGIVASPLITVCLGIQTSIPCSGPTTIYSCQAVNFSCVQSNPFNGDFNGNFAFWATASTTYTITIQGVGVNGFIVYYAAPLVFGGGGVFSSITSSSANPALSGFIRMASLDQICWRNNANTADICISKNTSDNLFFGANQFAFLSSGTTFPQPLCINNGTANNCLVTTATTTRTTTLPDNSGTLAELNLIQTWTATQTFAGLQWKAGTAFSSILTNTNTAARTYTFPDLSDNVVLRSSTDTLTNKTLTTPVINGASTGTGVQGTDTKLATDSGTGSTGALICRDGLGGIGATGCGTTVISLGTNGSVCTTGTSNGATCTTSVTITPTQPDTSYIANCSGTGAITGYPFIIGLSKAIGSITVTISNGAAAQAVASTISELDCSAIHP